MALQIHAIGAAKGVGSVALPIALRGLHGLGKGLSFAGTLDQKLLDLSGDNSLLSQIAGLIQAGTPMATIVDRIAKDPNVRGTLERALASSLAPPGTSPPASRGTQQLAATLEQQITKLLTTLKSETTTAGQQSEFSGQVLDAKSARETPAQQKNPTPTDSSVDAVASFARMLVQKAIASVQGKSDTQSAAPATTATSQSPDILTRMLARAANADAQRTDAAPQRAGTLAVQQTGQLAAAPASTHTTTNAAPSSTLFERLVAIIAEHKSGTQSDANPGKQFSQDTATAQPAAPASSAHQTQSNPSAAPVFSTQLASASAPATPAQATPNHYTNIDPQSVIEQLVKGITLRNSGTTSEVRMRLQPEQLGDVALKLTVTGNTITANVIAQNAHVRDLLLSNQQQLARSLADAGLSLGNFSVDVSGGNAGFSHQQAQQQRTLVKTGGFGLALASEEEPSADSRFGPSLLPAGKALVLNYLA